MNRLSWCLNNKMGHGIVIVLVILSKVLIHIYVVVILHIYVVVKHGYSAKGVKLSCGCYKL